MYFNDENNKTNIDDEFSDSKKQSFDLKVNKKVILIIVAILVLGICFLLLLPKVLKTEYYLVLNGLDGSVNCTVSSTSTGTFTYGTSSWTASIGSGWTGGQE